MFKERKPLVAFRVPTLVEAGGDVADLVARRATLTAKARELEAERQRLWTAAQEGADDGDDAVAALLGDAPDASNPSRQTARRRLEEIARESATLAKAIAVIDGRMNAARNSASAKIRDEVRPEYRDRVRSIFSALVAAHEAHRAYSDLISDLDVRDVAWSPLSPLQPHRILGDPRDKYGPLAIWMRDAAAAGYIEITEIPERLR